MQSSSGKETLELVRLDVYGSFNSFRIPSGIKYHRTFYIPTSAVQIPHFALFLTQINSTKIKHIHNRASFGIK